MEDLINLSHALSKFVIGYEGNVSCVVENGFLIKASGKSLLGLTENDIVLCDHNNHIIGNTELNPSMEIEFHSWLLKFWGINYVAHTHPINVLKILSTDHTHEFAKERLFPDQVVFNGKEYCVVDYAHPGKELFNKISKSITEYCDRLGQLPKVILLKNHGIITIGRTAEECLISTEICEKAAEIFLGIKQIGLGKYLTKNDIEIIENDEKEKYRQNFLKK